MYKSKNRTYTSGKITGALLAAVLISGIILPVSAEAKTEESIKLTPASVTLFENKTKTVSLKKNDKKISKGIKFSSSDKKTATVSSKGTIKAIKAGKAKITAKYEGKKYICNVTVKAAKKGVENLKLSIDKVNSIVMKAYGDGAGKYTDGSDFVNAKSRSYGIKNVVNGGQRGNWSSPQESYMAIYRIIEMDTGSKQYQSLKAGQKIKLNYKGERDDTVTVSAINHQYVLCVYELYTDDSGKQVLNQKSPFKFKGLDSAIKAFKKIAD